MRGRPLWTVSTGRRRDEITIPLYLLLTIPRLSTFVSSVTQYICEWVWSTSDRQSRLCQACGIYAFSSLRGSAATLRILATRLLPALAALLLIALDELHELLDGA